MLKGIGLFIHAWSTINHNDITLAAEVIGFRFTAEMIDISKEAVEGAVKGLYQLKASA